MTEAQPPGSTLRAPPADDWEPRRRRSQERRDATVASLVDRCLDPAMGVAVRVLDPLGDDTDGRERARMVAMDAIAGVARQPHVRREGGADDAAVVAVMGRVADGTMDAAIGRSLSVHPLPELELGVSAPLSLALVQDVNAAARRADRRVACVVVAAGVQPEVGCALLGLDWATMSASLRRIGRRLREATVDTSEDLG